MMRELRKALLAEAGYWCGVWADRKYEAWKLRKVT
jgi:hypothetical protein